MRSILLTLLMYLLQFDHSERNIINLSLPKLILNYFCSYDSFLSTFLLQTSTYMQSCLRGAFSSHDHSTPYYLRVYGAPATSLVTSGYELPAHVASWHLRRENLGVNVVMSSSIVGGRMRKNCVDSWKLTVKPIPRSVLESCQQKLFYNRLNNRRAGDLFGYTVSKTVRNSFYS